jgi:PAS domain S-box-containing protein
VWFRDESILVRDEDGTPAYWQGVMLDITERVRAEEQLREAESRYRALVEQTPVVTYLEALKPSNVTLYISPQVEGFLGYAPEEITRPEPVWPGLMHADDYSRVMSVSDQAERDESPFNIEFRLVAKDGHVVWVHDQAVLIRDDEGRPLFWQGVWVDITERKRAAELERALEAEREQATQLRAVDEMKNTFLQAVSHDLRTPLAAILGLAVTLERQDLELNADETKDLASRIAANARKLDRIVNDLLDLDRLGRGIVEPNLEPVDVGALIVQILDASELLAGREVHVEADTITAQIDPAKVERIVENLLANAVRYTPAGTGIWVRVCPHDEGVLLVVEDEGPGVAIEHREQIFEPFRQGPGAPEHSPGVGIGLALVARFAELHGGHAWVEDRPGGGASFRVWVPLAPPMT